MPRSQEHQLLHEWLELHGFKEYYRHDGKAKTGVKVIQCKGCKKATFTVSRDQLVHRPGCLVMRTQRLLFDLEVTMPEAP